MIADCYQLEQDFDNQEFEKQCENEQEKIKLLLVREARKLFAKVDPDSVKDLDQMFEDFWLEQTKHITASISKPKNVLRPDQDAVEKLKEVFNKTSQTKLNELLMKKWPSHYKVP